MKDGVSDRLITVNPTALNVPAFKNAGWGVDIKRAHSPPIPSGPAGEYFTTVASLALNDEATVSQRPRGDETSVLLGSRFSSDSTDAPVDTKQLKMGAAARMEMHREEDDSSDISDDSDDDQNSETYARETRGGQVWANGCGRQRGQTGTEDTVRLYEKGASAPPSRRIVAHPQRTTSHGDIIVVVKESHAPTTRRIPRRCRLQVHHSIYRSRCRSWS